ncbi:hypothetical protein ECO55CA74_13085 [Escherichia coli O55:H7 str. RM12579]|nr:hypothetical protein ECO55CA74_13085 [Escherichia coli O55:H7 str. RM12579]
MNMLYLLLLLHNKNNPSLKAGWLTFAPNAKPAA